MSRKILNEKFSKRLIRLTKIYNNKEYEQDNLIEFNEIAISLLKEFEIVKQERITTIYKKGLLKYCVKCNGRIVGNPNYCECCGRKIDYKRKVIKKVW